MWYTNLPDKRPAKLLQVELLGKKRGAWTAEVTNERSGIVTHKQGAVSGVTRDRLSQSSARYIKL